jgi:DNA-directed RNA polymerase specialized sigma24 family protein
VSELRVHREEDIVDERHEADAEDRPANRPTEPEREAICEDTGEQPSSEIVDFVEESQTLAEVQSGIRVSVVPAGVEQELYPADTEHTREGEPECQSPEKETGEQLNTRTIDGERSDAEDECQHDLPLSDKRLSLFFARGVGAYEAYVECHTITTQICDRRASELGCEAHDIAQNVAIRCAERYIDHPPEGRRAATRTATYRAIARRFGQRARESQPLPPEELVGGSALSPPEQLIARERVATIWELTAVRLNGLGFAHAAAWYFREVIGMEYSEIARRLGITSAAARQRVSRANEELGLTAPQYPEC